MKFSINKNAFLNELSVCLRAISSRTTIPILSGIKITLNEAGLKLTGSDGEVSIETFLSKDDEKAELNISEYGEIVLKGRFLNELIRKIPESTVYFELLENYQMQITSGKAEFTVNGLDSNSYPHLPIADTQINFKLPVILFKNIINETVFAVSTSESRPILTGVHFKMLEQKLTAVATDSHRLSQREIEINDTVDNFNIVIPGKSLTEFAKAVSEDTELIEICIMENQVLFKTERMKFYSRLLEGNYPDTSRLIPSSFSTELSLNVPDFLATIDRASLFSHVSRNNIVRIEIAEDQVTIQSNSPEIGKVTEEVNYIKVTGEPQKISFNPDYMKNALQAFGDTDIVIKFISPIRPFTLEPLTQEELFIQLITPVRTND